MPAPLIVTERDWEGSLRSLGRDFHEIIEPEQGHIVFQKIPGGAESRSTYMLWHRPTELTAIDQRGGQLAVVPLCRRDEDHLLIAVGLDWWQKGRKKLRFASLQFVLFHASGALAAEQTSPASRKQVMRLEWQGPDDDGLLEAPLAAHPHWQVDLAQVEPLSVGSFAAGPQDLAEVLKAPRRGIDDSWIGKMHLAAGAQWDQSKWRGTLDEALHAHAPRDLQALLSWMLSACAYFKQEATAAFSF
jgi:hypothetical protein